MVEKQSAIVLDFKTNGQIQYAKTIKDITAIMNAAAKEYRAQIKAMGDNATATDKLRAEKRKLETQLEAGRERTQKLREEFVKMQGDSKTTTAQLNNMYGKLKDSESAEAALESRLSKVNSELSEQAEASRKNQNELDKLQQESTELEAQTRKLNSELDLQESAMGDSATETEKAALAQEKYSKQSELVEKQISNLEKQLELVKQEYGENSIEANKMETELNEAKIAFNNLNNEMSNTRGSADEAQSAMGRMNTLLQSQIYMEASQQLSQISDKLIDLGKDSVETAATFRANEAQFSQVFGNMEDKARETVAAMGEQMGILPKRLEPGYAAISSQLMSLGVESEKALGLAEQALVSSADAAAFYDISLESAQERVQSFIKGNLSAAESIGIFATANGLATYAIQNGFVEASEEQRKYSEKMELSIEKAQKKVSDATAKYGAGSLEARDATQKLNEELEKQEKGLNLKSKWDELSEAQKQAVRIDYIENMQKMGKVTGQAAREMDGYENVMGNLDSAIDEIKASLGDELLTILVEFAQAVIPMLSGFAKWFSELSPVVKQFTVAFAGIIAVVGTLAPLIAVLGAAAAAAGVTIGALVVGTILPAIGVIAGIAAAIAGVILVIRNWGSIAEWLSEKWDSFIAFFSKLMNGMGEGIMKAFNEIKDALSEFFSGIWRGFTDFCSELGQGWNEFWSELFESILEFVGKAKDGFVNGFLAIKDSVVEKFVEIKDQAIEIWNQIIEFLQPIGERILSFIMVPVSLLKTLLEAVWLYIVAGFQILGAAIELAIQKIMEVVIQPIIDMATKISEKMSEIGQSVLNFFTQTFTQISEWFTQKGEELKAIATSVFTAFKKNIVDPVTNTVNEVVTKIVELWQKLEQTFSEIKTAALTKWNEIKDAIVNTFNSAKNAVFNTAGEIWSGVVGKFQQLLEGAKDKFTKIKNAMIEPVVAARDKIKEVIDAIKDFFFNIKLPKFSLKTSSKKVLGKEISYPSGIDVKWNARGGIFTQPTIFGASGGKLQGAGEAGPEAALPLNEETLGAIGRGIAATMSGFGKFEQHNHFGQVDANNPSDLERMNRKLEEANRFAVQELGGDPA